MEQPRRAFPQASFQKIKPSRFILLKKASNKFAICATTTVLLEIRGSPVLLADLKMLATSAKSAPSMRSTTISTLVPLALAHVRFYKKIRLTVFTDIVLDGPTLSMIVRLR